jgi:hypothetical protein
MLLKISWNSHEHNNYSEMEEYILDTNAGKQHSGVEKMNNI